MIPPQIYTETNGSCSASKIRNFRDLSKLQMETFIRKFRQTSYNLSWRFLINCFYCHIIVMLAVRSFRFRTVLRKYISDHSPLGSIEWKWWKFFYWTRQFETSCWSKGSSHAASFESIQKNCAAIEFDLIFDVIDWTVDAACESTAANCSGSDESGSVHLRVKMLRVTLPPLASPLRV